MFSVRNTADAATRRAVRALEYDLGVPIRTVSEYRVQEIGQPKLMILPSPRVLTQFCWETLLARVEAGATLLVTGPIDWDEYWRPVPRLNRLDSGLETETRPVTRFDDFIEEIGKPWHRLDFGGDRIAKVEKVILSGDRIEKSNELVPHPNLPGAFQSASDEDQMEWRLFSIPHGQGRVLYFRYPVELTDSGGEALFHLYKQACSMTGIPTHAESAPGHHGFLVRPMPFTDSLLILATSEAEHYGDFTAQFPDYSLVVCAGGEGEGAPQAGAAFLNPNSGEILAEYGYFSTIRKETEENAKEENPSPSNESSEKPDAEP